MFIVLNEMIFLIAVLNSNHGDRHHARKQSFWGQELADT